jgi:predicted MFS family arabinose efflux permease
MVAIIQLPITMGATVGGLFYGASGYQTFGVSANYSLCVCLLAYLASRSGRRIAQQ